MSTSTSRLQVPVTSVDEKWLRNRAELNGRIDRRISPARQAASELERWRMMLAAELRRIRLTLPQALCLGHLVGPVPLDRVDPGTAALVYTRAYEQLTLSTLDELEEGVDLKGLLSYLHLLGPTADHALHQALAAWHEAGAEPSVEAFAQVGLHVVQVGDRSSKEGSLG